MTSLRGVILAAGFATRMYPLTRDVAKPLLEIGGEPLATRLVRQLQETGVVDDVVVVVNGRFADDFRAWRDALVQHDEVTVPITIVDDGVMHDTEHLGALADLALALDAPRATPPDGTLVVAGDNLFTFALAPYVERFVASGEPQLVLRRITPPIPPRRYSDVTVSDDGVVTSFREKPDDPGGLTAIAVYVLPPTLRDELAGYFEQGGERDAPGHFLAWLCARRTVRATPFAGEWFDIGNLEQLDVARARFG